MTVCSLGNETLEVGVGGGAEKTCPWQRGRKKGDSKWWKWRSKGRLPRASGVNVRCVAAQRCFHKTLGAQRWPHLWQGPGRVSRESVTFETGFEGWVGHPWAEVREAHASRRGRRSKRRGREVQGGISQALGRGGKLEGEAKPADLTARQTFTETVKRINHSLTSGLPTSLSFQPLWAVQPKAWARPSSTSPVPCPHPP